MKLFISCVLALAVALGYGLAFSSPKEDPAAEKAGSLAANFKEAWVDTGTYRYRVAVNAEDLLLVDTQIDLTLEKDGRVLRKEDLPKASPAGKDLYGRLLKLEDVSAVVIGPRRLEIAKFPYKTSWEKVLPEVLKTLDTVLK